MHEMDVKQVLDWVVPGMMATIAWYLRRLDSSVRELSHTIQRVSTDQAVTIQRLDDVERRVEKLED